MGIKCDTGKLLEDGVYGKNTLGAWDNFMSNLEHGVVPTLAWVDPLKNNSLDLKLMDGDNGTNNMIYSDLGEKINKNGKVVSNKDILYRIDPPHYDKKGNPKILKYRDEWIPIDYNHLNVEFDNSTKTYSEIAKKYNHTRIPDKLYNQINDLEKFGKKVRIGGRILVVAGIVLDTIELGTTINKDLKDTDKKLGKKTVKTTAEIGGRWAGAWAGAELGAMAGAFTGPLSPIAVPVLAVVGGVGGAFAGDAIAGKIVDITYKGE